MSQPTSGPQGPQRVAVVIPARNDKSTIAPTVRACRAIPAVDLIIVVDDGSEDDTGQVARGSGAVVVRHSVPRGRASALETGTKVVAMRDRTDWPARNILFLDPDLGDSAVEAASLVDAVNDGVADCAIGVSKMDSRSSRGSGIEQIALQAIKRSTGWSPTEPLAGQRCITREAVDAIMPMSTGAGADVGATIDLLVKGFTVIELPCAFERIGEHPKAVGLLGKIRKSDVWWAVQARRLKMAKVPRKERVEAAEQGVGIPYSTNPEKHP